MSVDPQTRQELFLRYEAAGFLELEPEERQAITKHKGGRGNKKPWVDPTCRSCGEQFPAPRGTRRTMCPSCLKQLRKLHYRATLQSVTTSACGQEASLERLSEKPQGQFLRGSGSQSAAYARNGSE